MRVMASSARVLGSTAKMPTLAPAVSEGEDEDKKLLSMNEDELCARLTALLFVSGDASILVWRLAGGSRRQCPA